MTRTQTSYGRSVTFTFPSSVNAFGRLGNRLASLPAGAMDGQVLISPQTRMA